MQHSHYKLAVGTSVLIIKEPSRERKKRKRGNDDERLGVSCLRTKWAVKLGVDVCVVFTLTKMSPHGVNRNPMGRFCGG